MKRTFLNSKIHRATITGSQLNYMGSMAIDAQLMKAANILPFERVEIVNVNNGQRWATYVIEAEAGSGKMELRGAASRLAEVGDIVIIFTYIEIEEPIPVPWQPRLVMVDENNQVSEILEMPHNGSDLLFSVH
ncbi:MAG TPA: aspartate 1-decarboxylase [Cyanothece sp. UBA12306]|nr:aspartate 1-decarboxylase [Cyanothece sp. UBA12306]